MHTPSIRARNAKKVGLWKVRSAVIFLKLRVGTLLFLLHLFAPEILVVDIFFKLWFCFPYHDWICLVTQCHLNRWWNACWSWCQKQCSTSHTNSVTSYLCPASSDLHTCNFFYKFIYIYFFVSYFIQPFPSNLKVLDMNYEVPNIMKIEMSCRISNIINTSSWTYYGSVLMTKENMACEGHW